MEKIINPCKVMVGKQYAQVFCKIEIKDGVLSITGVIGPTRGGNARGGCGQINTEFKRPLHSPKEQPYFYDMRLKDWQNFMRSIIVNTGWTRPMFHQFLAVWDKWHLNNMRSACEHQRAMGWTYETHRGDYVKKEIKNRFVIDEYATGEVEIIEVFDQFKGQNCPVCGYSIGSAWLKEELPQNIIDFLSSLPDTTRQPAWV